MIGTTLHHYRITRALGSGGMGEVFLAEDTRLKRSVALKILPPTFAVDLERRARFEREAQAIAALNHPHIVTIHGVEQSGDTHFIVMEFVDGQTLAEVIPPDGLRIDRLLAIAVPLADAVATAHEYGIVHRDLKPANVMIGAQDRVKVLDFGLAKLRESASAAADATMLPAREITGEGRIVGTVASMSPEQAEGKPVDARSDVFSLGVVLYEMASGTPPFKGDTSLSILSAILRDSPTPLTDLNPVLPRELSRIVRRCLAKDPDRRYQSAKDLRNDLDELKQSSLSGESPAASPVHAAPASRWRTATAILTTVTIGALAAVGWLLWRGPAAGRATATPSMTFNQLTLQPGVALDPSLSPDGKWVVYVNYESGNPDIYLQSTTGQTAINLTKDSPDADTMPAFSPDGDSIAFRSEREGGGLFVMGRTGDSVRRLTRHGFQPAWFPDGRHIVFASREAPVMEGRSGDVSELWIIEAGGGEPRRLFEGDAVQPRVSPKGRRIAFWALPVDAARKSYSSANRDIWTVSADGTNPVRVTTAAANDWNPVWSPDGRWLYFLSNRSGSMNLWRTAIDEASGATSGQPQPLTVPSPYIRHFSMSADGRLGAYATWQVTNNVARVAVDARSASVQGPMDPLTSGPREFGPLDVSPDGQQLVFTTSQRQQEDLYLMAANGSGLHQLTNDPARDRWPRWLPDGRHIIFYSDRGVFFDIWTIDRDGSGLRQLTTSDGRYYPTPAPDGSKVAASSIVTWNIYIYDAHDFAKLPETLPPFPEEWRQGTLVVSGWSPDGRELLGTTSAGPWAFSLDTRKYRRTPVVGGAGWFPDRRVLSGRQGRLFIADWLSGEARQVFAIPGETINGARLNADGSYVYFNHGSASGDIWMVRFDDTRR